MDLKIAGRKAIVCASSRGLGRGCAEALAAEGCDLVINGRDAGLLADVAKDMVARHGVTVTPVAGDVSDPAIQKALLDACPAPDILVNNNGGPPRRHYTELDREAMIDGVIQNMITPLELIQAVVAGMTERGFGRIVNITSLSVYMPIEGLDLSSGARAGLTAFLAGVLRQVAGSNVTVNNLLPGKMDTDRLRTGLRASAAKAGSTEDEEAARQMAAIPARRFGSAEEFGEICAFICSDHAGYITGQNLLIDGGSYPGTY